MKSQIDGRSVGTQGITASIMANTKQIQSQFHTSIFKINLQYQHIIHITSNIFYCHYHYSNQAAQINIYYTFMNHPNIKPLPQFEPYRDHIPEFIIKLYHILEPQYHDYLCWHGQDQILVKNSKKLQQRVLPLFFRHKHITSFVRQLNMYKFGKVTKLTKQKNYMYFKNQYFKRGDIQSMIKIQRKSKKSLQQKQIQKDDEDAGSVASIQNRLVQPPTFPLIQYKNHVKTTMKEIVSMLMKVQSSHPNLKTQLGQIKSKCQELMQIRSQNSNFSYLNLEDENNQNKNMMTTMKNLPISQQLMLPSLHSFFQMI